MLFAQLSDPHVTTEGTALRAAVDTPQQLREALGTLAALPTTPDVILLTGDLVNDGAAAEYELLADVLKESPAPILPIPGNHDDATHFRSLFEDVGVLNGDGACQYFVDVDAIRFIALDTTKPGFHDGELTQQGADWLDTTLAADPDRPAIVFMHHIPYATGAWWFDYNGLTGADRLRAVLDRHDNVLRVVSGHVHRETQTSWGHTILSSAPSTAYSCTFPDDGASPGVNDSRARIPMFRWNGQELLSFSTDVPGDHVHLSLSDMYEDVPRYTRAAKAGGPIPISDFD